MRISEKLFDHKRKADASMPCDNTTPINVDKNIRNKFFPAENNMVKKYPKLNGYFIINSCKFEI